MAKNAELAGECSPHCRAGELDVMPLTTIIALALCALGTLITCVNFYLTWIRYPLHRWRGGTRENYRWVSGFPLVGSLFLWIGAVLLVREPMLMWLAVAISLLDTAGLHWFAGTMLYMWLFHRRSRKA